MPATTKLLVLLEQAHPTGLVRQLIELLARLPEHGLRPRLVCITRREQDVGALQREIRTRGIAFDALVEAHAFDPGPLKQVRRIIEHWKPDILESHGYKTVAYARALTLVEPGLPWVAFYHGRTSTDWKVRLYHFFERWAVGAASAIAPVAEGVEDHFRRRDRIRLMPIPNGLVPIAGTDRNRAEVRKELGIRDGVPLLGFVGRFSREKAPDRFVEIFAELAGSHPSLHGIMLGDGALFADVQESIVDLGLAHRIRLPGRVSDVGNYYAAMDALLIPSRSEVFPNVLLEAVSAGIPVAAAPVGGIPSIADRVGTVFLAKSTDALSLAEAAARALRFRDPDQLERGRQRLEQDYSQRRRAELAAELYRSVLEGSL